MLEMWNYVNPPAPADDLSVNPNPYTLDSMSHDSPGNPEAAKLVMLQTVFLGPEKTVDEIKMILTELNRKYVITSVHLKTYSRLERSDMGLAPESAEAVQEKINAIMDLCPKPPLNHFKVSSGDRRVFEFHGPGTWRL